MRISKRIIRLTGYLLCICMAGPVAAQQEGIRTQYLGANHILLKIERPKRYVLLPIEEKAPEATVTVLADNRPVQRISVRLSLNKTDYFVPLDISGWSDRHVALEMRMENSRINMRDMEADACWQEITLADDFHAPNSEAHRPAFHFTPAYGWMNDPNGMFYKDGEWHLCYQWNPYGSMWGNLSWGHAVSRDLVHWEHLPAALIPDGLGMIFSGSCVVDDRNTAGFGEGAVVAMYTSASEHQMQSIAYSTDNGRTFTAWPLNPVISSDKECRDPNLFWDEEHGRWVLILACALEHEMWIYTSPDLKNWTKRSAFGRGYGAQEGVWECPDLMRLPIRGSDRTKWVMIVNINPGGPYGNSATQYFVGDFDGETFRCDSEPSVTKWMDAGMDHYATVSWSHTPAGRHTVIGWMSNWQYANEVPTQQYRSANTLPRELELFDGGDGEFYLAVTPAPEIAALRGKPLPCKRFTATQNLRMHQLPADGICEIELSLTPMPNCGKILLTLSNKAQEKVTMVYDPQKKQFSMDRSQSGKVDFSRNFPVVTSAETRDDGTLGIRLFIDRSSIEAFGSDGRFAMTNLVFPTKPYNTLGIRTEKGRCRINKLNIYPLNL